MLKTWSCSFIVSLRSGVVTIQNLVPLLLNPNLLHFFMFCENLFGSLVTSMMMSLKFLTA